MASRCLVDGCVWMSAETREDIAGCLATWHVYENHPDVWRSVIGDRPPVDPDPRDQQQRMAMILGRL